MIYTLQNKHIIQEYNPGFARILNKFLHKPQVYLGITMQKKGKIA